MITVSDILNVKQSGADWEDAEQVKRELSAIRSKRTPFHLKRKELDPVLDYKLRRQRGRTEHYRRAWRDDQLREVTEAAFGIWVTDRELEARARLAVLTALPGIGVAVASAILALAEPARYGIIDFRNWRQLFDDERRTFSIADYGTYMRRLRELSEEVNQPVQCVDWCIWQHDMTVNAGSS